MEADQVMETLDIDRSTLDNNCFSSNSVYMLLKS